MGHKATSQRRTKEPIRQHCVNAPAAIARAANIRSLDMLSGKATVEASCRREDGRSDCGKLGGTAKQISEQRKRLLGNYGALPKLRLLRQPRDLRSGGGIN
ncbi:hypothetical protein BKD09_17860 [Bradyrhizobium japonicum]|uniref:Uncharacterized protein n=1 Tax=Bradyrhizobium japonicum TaxID=375 RepID=A0A1L3FA54_BRAJP|nr:hypothetical protein BKD09_17860 [Bradyrhizobium japonicum]